MYDSVSSKQRIIFSKLLLVIFSGLMLTASFPPGKFSSLAWIALLPLLSSLKDQSPLQAFRLGLFAGFAHYLTLIYWIVIVLRYYGDLNLFFSLGPYLLLCCYLSLFPALFACLIVLLKKSSFRILWMGSFWVSLEYLRNMLLSGFPWCLLGYTQYQHLTIIQCADICGVYGVSFLIVLANGLFYTIFFPPHESKKNFFFYECPIIILLFVTSLGYGYFYLKTFNNKKGSSQLVKTSIIQGNIDQSLKWNKKHQTKTMEIYQSLTRTAYAFKPQLIVWPETATPFFFQNDTEFAPSLHYMANKYRASLFFGSPAYEFINGQLYYYNRSYLIEPDNELSKYYDKVHLVPFGEYVPLKKYLFFINRLVTAAGDFSPGKKNCPLKNGDLALGSLICFEVIFPELARKQVLNGANILINITNDAWFGKSSAPFQHLSMAVFRSVENRRPMARASNTGFSAFIGSQGQILKKSSLFKKEILNHDLVVSKKTLSFYTRFGDLFAIALLFLSAIKLTGGYLGYSSLFTLGTGRK